MNNKMVSLVLSRKQTFKWRGTMDDCECRYERSTDTYLGHTNIVGGVTVEVRGMNLEVGFFKNRR